MSKIPQTITLDNHQVIFDGIPAPLRKVPHWLVWRREGDHKTPFDARTGRKAAATDPASWAPFTVAARAVQRGAFEGVGFALCHADGLIAFDLDDALLPDGSAKPWAQTLIDYLRSYTEVSPSGRGLHIFVLAPKTRYAFNKLVRPVVHAKTGETLGKCEVFLNRSYLTVTGHSIGEPLPIALRANEAAYWIDRWKPPPIPPPVPSYNTNAGPIADDQTLLRRMFASKRGPAIRRLWDGDLTEFRDASSDGVDRHRADWRLIRDLAFWANGDAARIDALFRQSGLMRPKWDERHDGDGATYGEMTIRKVLATNPPSYTGRKSEGTGG